MRSVGIAELVSQFQVEQKELPASILQKNRPLRMSISVDNQINRMLIQQRLQP
ncbi:MAG: hypothetical protein HCA25_00380 (plasmid) [Dolichospermum sp. DET50]|nr:hypothetical protein [Dolichospermum sp. DET66]MBS3035963.1 hypothetical protein [Dolichospermum sp. DET67]MBS3041131.1 hypothetical protein [Dolichospermum sp. DET50]QSX71013.1 MAG: hypothetical protein EZY12_27105 [Dolichospermum sp. DET69]